MVTAMKSAFKRAEIRKTTSADPQRHPAVKPRNSVDPPKSRTRIHPPATWPSPTPPSPSIKPETEFGGSGMTDGTVPNINAKSNRPVGFDRLAEPPCEYSMAVASESQLRCLITVSAEKNFYQPPDDNGLAKRGEAATGYIDDERELVIGLDFGTSSTKVVIGDLALSRAYAVPFCARDGVERYLLPSRLYESEDRFSLRAEGADHRDLKLALMACPTDSEKLLRVAAFLALVIRHARAWLTGCHQDVYCRTRILWKLVVGLPAAHHLDGDHREIFHRVARMAWLAACSDSPVISRNLIQDTHRRTEAKSDEAGPMYGPDDVEIGIVPEIAAQIYGFVASGRFDRSASNRFMMVDVGAGTVDSSIFRVVPARGGRWDFDFFSSHVEQHGVMNLHRFRIGWWETALRSSNASSFRETHFVDMKLATDQLLAIPERLEDYFSGVRLTFLDSKRHPDETFFRSNVLAQVRGRTMHRTFTDGILTKNDLCGIPVFLCGGGMRMGFYRRLESELKNMPGCTWLRAEARALEVPGSLSAPGLARTDYDRMSVAFGLSFLETGKIQRCPPLATSLISVSQSWRDHYIDKDQC